MNQISRIQFDFRMQNKSFAQTLYGYWERFFSQSFEPIADAILTKHDRNAELIEIEYLEIDLGTISETNFYEQFPLILREKLEEALLAALYHSGTSHMRISETVHNQSPTTQAANSHQKEFPNSVYADLRIRALPDTNLSPADTGLQSLPLTPHSLRVISESDHILGLLTYFLLHGTLPWHADPKYKGITNLFLEVIRTNGKKLKQFLQTYGHYTSLQERLVYQLNDPELEQGVRLFAPSESTFIVSYVKMLVAKYKDITKPQIRETTYRHTVWKVIYAYLLTNRSSYFDKKSFITQTLTKLASAINISYDNLLHLLTDELDAWVKNEVIPTELFRLLSELKKEITEEIFRTMAVDPVKLYKTWKEVLSRDLTGTLNQPTRDALITVLSKPDSCRTFLQYLTEEAIIRLVPVVVPHESRFVISYAHSLDRQKEQDRLAGKAGNEFRTLKWQVIFPLLFENKGSSLHRKYFVTSVLRKIASHYNLSIVELIAYFNQRQTQSWLDNELKEIFLQLYEEIQPTVVQTETIPDNMIDLLNPYLQSHKEITAQQQKKLFEKLSDQATRKKLFGTVTEDEQKKLIRLLFRQENEFILSHASSLEKQEKTKQLEGKTGSGFRQLKWEFIWTVLTKDSRNGFNRQHFVAGVLKTLASHYNLGYAELLSYFYTENALRLFPPEIQKILETLYLDEIRLLIRQSASVLSVKSRQTLLTILVQFSKTVPESFILDYIQFLNDNKKTGLLPHIPASGFQAIVWKQVFEILFPSGAQNNFNKRQFVKRLLERIARHYQITLSGLTDAIQWYTKQIENIPAEIRHIQNKIYKENTNSQNTIFNVKNEMMETTIYIQNGGMILLAPFFPRLFSMLELTADNQFRDDNNRLTALFGLQYAVYGKENYSEPELTLNKILTGIPVEQPIPRQVELTDQQRTATQSMVEGAKSHWEKLRNTSLEGFREAFLQREGKIEIKEDHYQLTIEEKAYDLLLDSLPWNFRITKFPWMEKRLEAKWR